MHSMRNHPLVLFILTLATFVVACSSSPSDGAATNAADGNDAGHDTDAAACVIAASSYDQSCQTAADCVGVPVGGNTCDPCHAGSGHFACPLAAINASASAQYTAALAAAFQSVEGTTTYQQCVVNACPTNPTPACNAGKCVVEYGVQGTDAGTDTRDAPTGG